MATVIGYDKSTMEFGVNMTWWYDRTHGKKFWHFEGPKGTNMGDTSQHSCGATCSDDAISEVKDVNT